MHLRTVADMTGRSRQRHIQGPSSRERVQDRLTVRERTAFERAQHTGYLVALARDKNVVVAWKTWCRANRRPELRVRLGKHYATLFVDLSSTGRTITPAGQAAFTALGQLVAEGWVCCTRTWAMCIKVPAGAVFPLAQLLRDILSGFTNATSPEAA